MNDELKRAYTDYISQCRLIRPLVERVLTEREMSEGLQSADLMYLLHFRDDLVWIESEPDPYDPRYLEFVDGYHKHVARFKVIFRG